MLHSIFSSLVAPVLIPTARELGKNLVKTLFPDRKSRQDPRWQKAQLEYLHASKLGNQLKELELQQQWEIARLQRELLRELQANEIQFKLKELQTLWDRHEDNWFSTLNRQETELILNASQQEHHLLILASPPRISQSCPNSFQDNLTIELSNHLRYFLTHHYPLSSPVCPVEFYGDYFKRPISDIDVKRLQNLLSPVPTAILYSDISEYEVNFHVGFWGVTNPDTSLFTLPPWNWENTKAALEAVGESEVVALRKIRQVIVTVQQLLAIFVADLYYLNLNPHYSPKLLELEPQFLEAGFSEEGVQPYLKVLTEFQQQQLADYEAEIQKLDDYITRKERPWRCERTLRHSAYVRTLALSPDGQTLVSGSKDKSIKMWNLANGRIHCTLKAHADEVSAVAISPDGKYFVSSSDNRKIKVWQPLPYELLGHADAVLDLAISPDSTTLVSSSADRTIKVWDLSQGALVRTLTGHSEKIWSVTISPDGQLIVSGSDDATIKIWHLHSGQLIRTLSEHDNHVYGVAITPDGQTLVSASADETVKVWDLATGQLIYNLTGHSCSAQSVAISPDGQTLAVSNWGCSSNKYRDAVIKLWHLPTGQLLNTLTGYSAAIRPLVFTPDGKSLISGSYDAAIKVWRWDS